MRLTSASLEWTWDLSLLEDAAQTALSMQVPCVKLCQTVQPASGESTSSFSSVFSACGTMLLKSVELPGIQQEMPANCPVTPGQ